MTLGKRSSLQRTIEQPDAALEPVNIQADQRLSEPPVPKRLRTKGNTAVDSLTSIDKLGQLSSGKKRAAKKAETKSLDSQGHLEHDAQQNEEDQVPILSPKSKKDAAMPTERRKGDIFEQDSKDGSQSNSLMIPQANEKPANGSNMICGGVELVRYTRSPATALESALSNSPCAFNYKLFESYKVASQLPPDIFEHMCKEQLLNKRVSDFTVDLNQANAPNSTINQGQQLGQHIGQDPSIGQQESSNDCGQNHLNNMDMDSKNSNEIQNNQQQQDELDQIQIERALSGQELGPFDTKTNYFRLFWRGYLDNEQLLKEVQDAADENYKSLKRIHNIEDYYEHKLMPKLVSFPTQYLNRIKMIQQQKNQNNKRIEAQKTRITGGMIVPDLQQKNDGKSNIDDDRDQSDSKIGDLEQSQVNCIEKSNAQQINNTSGVDSQQVSPFQGNKDSKEEQNADDQQTALKKKQAHAAAELRKKQRKKHMRRTAKEIDRSFICPYESCQKVYGSEGSLNLHIKIKHNGGNKTDREKLARSLVTAHLAGDIKQQIELVDLNLPPGTLTKVARKQGLVGHVEENELLRQVQMQLQEKQNSSFQRLSQQTEGTSKNIMSDQLAADIAAAINLACTEQQQSIESAE